MTTIHDEIQKLLDLAAAIAKKVGQTKATFLNGQMYREAMVAEVDGFTFKAEKNGVGVEVVFKHDPFISRAGSEHDRVDGGTLIRVHYGRYDAPTRIPEIARAVGIEVSA